MRAVCENPLAMMLEYVFFDFAPFGLEALLDPPVAVGGGGGGGNGVIFGLLT